jgi:hypothetical protein
MNNEELNRFRKSTEFLGAFYGKTRMTPNFPLSEYMLELLRPPQSKF